MLPESEPSPAAEVERCHAAACKELGIRCWTELCDSSFDLRPDEGEALRKVPALTEFIVPSMFGGDRYPWGIDDLEWVYIYMEVAEYGAKLLGLDLKWSRLDAHQIDAGCEAAGYVQ